MSSRNQRIEELENQSSRFSQRLDYLKALNNKFSWLRLAIFISGVVTFFLLFFLISNSSAYISAAVFITLFGIVVQLHNKVEFSIKKCLIWIKLKQNNIARIKVDWDSIPYLVEIAADKSHPFESDLNITGRHSLLHLINNSVSHEGTKILHDWLTQKEPEITKTKERQKLIKELTHLVRFREKLKLNSQLTYKPKKESRLLEHLKPQGDINSLKKILRSLFIIIPVNIILFLLFLILEIPAFFSIGLLLQLAVYWFNSRDIHDLYEKAENIKDELGKFSRIFEFLELYNYGENKALKNFCAPFFRSSFSPSQKFRQINRTLIALSFQKYPVTKLLLNLLFPWDFYQAYRLEVFKQEISSRLPTWLNTWYNLEAYISLANLAWINPHYTFPEIIDSEADTVFTSKGMGHPLIPFYNNIINDFTFEKIGHCVIITGSNMSGKSTFLKTVGLNLALGFAGGPVCASEMKTRLFRVFTCINITDSVTDGISYFYAEVKRLKKLLDELKKPGELPMAYLIDEIFRGTNNLERLAGSRSFIKELAGAKGIGLISTHDLELVKLEKEIASISNYHFKEEVLGDKMIFDYKIHPGPCPTTNALKIMKLEGLPIDNK